jgi:hypothetical protein
VPDDMAGRVPVEIIEPEALRRRPPRHTAAAAPPPAPANAGLAFEADEHAAVLERLRALGYVE